MRFGKVFSGLALAAAMAGAARAQTVSCPPVKPGEELRDLPEIRADRGTKKLDTTLRIQLRTLCLPTFQNGLWLNLPTQLRTYGFPGPDGWVWGYPGPVLRLRKANAADTADTEGGQGDSLSILLRNELPAGSEDNDTNLHFHGGHVSPQFPHDDVTLVLRPGGSQKDAGAHAHGRVVEGETRYEIDPLLWTQPEGTHWYHPHKHGAVSLQVANGMAGALIVEGPFDDWLRMSYGWKIKEKILVIQRVEPGTDLYGEDDFGPGHLPAPLVNGQVQPVITMAPGEVQRWRFVNATVGPLSQLDLRFPPGATVRQIAMDGVRFAPENYERQPLPYQLSPGNRADFLVQAPQAVGDHPVSYGVFAHMAGAEANGEILVTIRVAASSASVATGFPDKGVWPPMPSYLKDIQPEEIRGTVDLSFDRSAPEDFNISGRKFDGNCVNVTTVLGTAMEWNVRNTTDPLHPFHIHSNPFQVIRHAGKTYSPPYVWQDTISLPAGSEAAPASVLLRQRYLDFTGEYVLHCHFLEHEDQGMMYAVQTVCPQDPGSFGKARPGGQPECVADNLVKASLSCTVRK
ncbi:MAG TPA: multicopper oxidase domain-containing protein [Thermoanaerobaculia bacterium]|jgi:FtsP/CotA-like multicopper oxidase with cupredoxin domain|nr:multicopper oxidase domain-containing protein [Thermoanaerobaculia bacterium]